MKVQIEVTFDEELIHLLELLAPGRSTEQNTEETAAAPEPEPEPEQKIETPTVLERSASIPLCACGCGRQVAKRQNRYVNGHAGRRRKLPEDRNVKLPEVDGLRVLEGFVRCPEQKGLEDVSVCTGCYSYISKYQRGNDTFIRCAKK